MRITIFLGLFLSVISTQGQGLSQEEKKAGLTLAWKTAQDQFVYFDQVSVNWDSLYQANLPQVLASNSTKEYYEILIKFYAQLKDGHTWIWYPDSINDQLNTIPIETALIENKIIVTNVLNPELSKRIHRGDEIVTIQGISAIEYGRQFIMPFVSSSTEQDLLLRTYSYDLFLGNMDEDVRLELKRQQDNSVQTIQVSRNLEFTNTFQSYEFQVLSDNVGYLKINTFYERNYKAIFDSLYSVILPPMAFSSILGKTVEVQVFREIISYRIL
ncbi:hypothetical protein KFE98_01740 [bacterium SCSIO 12741]|nr:hypothetical protein KFE98_01740 [bacterium SCSIO 12741]